MAQRTALACPPPPGRLPAGRWVTDDQITEMIRAAFEAAVIALRAELSAPDPESGPNLRAVA